MKQLQSEISDAIRASGMEAGGAVFVHPNLAGLTLRLLATGARQDVVENAAALLYGALRDAAGNRGTIVAPAFFYDYARYGTPFDAAGSPPDKSLGAFPAHILGQAGALRSLCPPVSMVALGARAKDICDCGGAYGYGALSPWQVMTGIGAQLLFWDCSPRFMTFVHHVETLAGVPHLYNKIYSVPVRGHGGPYQGPVVSAVRFRDERFEIIYDLGRFIDEAASEGLIRSHEFGIIEFHLGDMAGIAAFLMQKLSLDPYYLLARPPNFVAGEIPVDGAAGAENNRLGARF